MVLHAHLRHLLPGGPVDVHVAPRHHREEGGEGGSGPGLSGRMAGGGQDLGGLGRCDPGHLLDPDHQNGVGEAGLDGLDRLVDGGASRRARALDVGHRDRAKPQPGADERGEVVLPGEAFAGEAAQVHRADVGGGDAGVVQGGAGRLGGQLVEGSVGKRAVVGTPGADDRYTAHVESPWSKGEDRSTAAPTRVTWCRLVDTNRVNPYHRPPSEVAGKSGVGRPARFLLHQRGRWLRLRYSTLFRMFRAKIPPCLSS